MRKSQLVFQFKITLLEISPSIWRRVQVPASYSFWDLHVAIQDAMGWLDYHLHAFRFPQSGEQGLEIGIPFGGFLPNPSKRFNPAYCSSPTSGEQVLGPMKSPCCQCDFPRAVPLGTVFN